MVSKDMLMLGRKRSCIRELFEFGKQRAAEVGSENVYDFSLGNPSVPAPLEVKQAINEILEDMTPIAVHGYTSAPGDNAARDAIAADLNERFHTAYTRKNLYLCCGAAAALTSCLRALTVSETTEIIAFAPFFPEYTCFTEAAGAKLVVMPADIPDFQINFEAFEAAINEHTQAVIINTPNNPSGCVYSEETIKKLSAILHKKEEELGRPLYLLSDEPYRELVYDGVKLPFIPRFYNNTIICYSYSKSLSLPGERIGYVLVPDAVDASDEVYDAIAGAARSMGYVCAPSLMQQVIARCAHVKPDLAPYIANRELLYNALTEMGYVCAKPQGAFYMFIQAPGGDSAEFSERAKKYNLLLVPGADFYCPEYLRISYCVDNAMIKRSLPAFKALIEEYK